MEKGLNNILNVRRGMNTFNRLQYVYKILLNSTYGALGNKYFKFFDIRMAESTTRCGRDSNAYDCQGGRGNGRRLRAARSAFGVDNELEFHPSSPAIVYGDTDSCYFDTYGEDYDDAFEIASFVEKKVNQSFEDFVKLAFNSSNNVIAADWT